MNATWLHNPKVNTDCTIIAEIGQAHDGSLGTAHAYIDCVAECGADAVKFQTHIADAESTSEEPWRVRFSRQDEARIDYWRRMEFKPTQWHELKAHAADKGLLFMSSPFSLEAVALLDEVGVAAFKVASGETVNHILLEAMAKAGRPVIISTGMSDIEEVDAAVACVRSHGVPTAVLQCVSAYPCPPDSVGLNVPAEFRERYGCAVGLSDHSGTIYPGLAAVAGGIEVLEVHATFSRAMFGPDVPSSLTPTELRQLVDGVRFIEEAHRHPVDKRSLPEGAKELRKLFTQSVVVTQDLEAGTILQRSHLTTKKPGHGIAANDLLGLVGRRLCRDVEKNSFLSHDDLSRDDLGCHSS